MNEVVLKGRLTRDPEVRYTPGGKMVATFTLAVEHYVRQEKRTNFIACVVWEPDAHDIDEHARKGTKVSICGYIQTRSYKNKVGQTVYVTEVVSDSVNLL